MSERHFISYPKSGRTWLRYILTELSLAHHIHFHHDGFEFSDPRMEPHDFDRGARARRYEGHRIVYLERDPRDVMVSLYSQITGRMRDVFGYQGSISEFIRHEYFGAETLRRFRDMWTPLASQLNCLRISYEDCHRDMAGTMRPLLNFYDFEVTDQALAEAVANARFDRMKEVEQGRQFPQPWLRPRNEAVKLRRGLVGGFREELNANDIAYLNSVFVDHSNTT